MRIQSKILVLIFVTVLATGGVATLVGRAISMNTVEDEISDHLVSTAQSRTHHIQTVLDSQSQTLQVTASAAAMYVGLLNQGFGGITRDVARPLSASLIQGMARSNSQVRKVAYVYSDGVVEHSWPEDLTGLDVSETEAFRRGIEAYANGQVVVTVGDTDFGDEADELLLTAVAPVSVNGRLDAVMVMCFAMEDLSRITIDATGLGETGEVYIVDEDGYMLTPSRFKGEEAILTQKVDLSGIQPYLGDLGDSGVGGEEWKVVSSTNYMGSKVFGVYSYLPELGWTVVVEKGSSEAYAPVSSLTRTMLWTLFAILLLGTLASFLISRALSRPILRLHRGAEEIMNGNWDYDVSTSAKDEIGALSRAFSKMTANLKKSHEALKEYSEGLEVKVEERTRELATANEELSKEIAERKEAQESLARSESYFRSLIENAPDMIIVLNADGTLRYVSPSAVRLHGLPLEEAIGKSCFDWIHPDDLPRVSEIFERAVRDPGYTASINLRARSKEGLWRSFELVGQNFLHDPAVNGIVINYHDITERKQAEEALQRAHDELEVRVRERTAQLANANEVLQGEVMERQKAEEQIRASLKEKEVLLKEIHHRVKNNLQVISSLLNLQAANLTDESTLVMFKESQNRVKSMALIHERLYQSKDLAKVDFTEYLQNLATHLFRTYGAKSSSIDLKVDVKDVSLSIDSAVPCGLIVNELLTNALKYAFPVGVGARERETKAEI
ncbi:MAG: PAS domain S-box protein, partial [Chloroflexi bacterium]|nr:PAS domain S-box protein [Chloroflexota bacterium]